MAQAMSDAAIESSGHFRSLGRTLAYTGIAQYTGVWRFFSIVMQPPQPESNPRLPWHQPSTILSEPQRRLRKHLNGCVRVDNNQSKVSAHDVFFSHFALVFCGVFKMSFFLLQGLKRVIRMRRKSTPNERRIIYLRPHHGSTWVYVLA